MDGEAISLDTSVVVNGGNANTGTISGKPVVCTFLGFDVPGGIVNSGTIRLRLGIES